jgi:histidinol-phosphatase (PHP family)
MAPNRYVDYHIHTAVTIDGNMHEFEVCERAVALGIQEIAFTNHVMLSQPNYRIAPQALKRHWENIQSARQRFPELTIRLGIEMDYYPGKEDEIDTTIRVYERLIGQRFDFILGSVHDIYGGFFSNKAEAVQFFKARDMLDTYREFFELETRAAKSHLFEVMAHPDLIKKYSHQMYPPVPFEAYREYAGLFVSELVRSNVGIEVNTKGTKLPVHETYPSPEFIALYLSGCEVCGAEPVITIGSDAHKIDDLGFGVAEVYTWLQELKVSHITCFDQRQRIKQPL